MTIDRDYDTIDAAREIFAALGTVAGDYQLYTADHPRLGESAARVVELLERHFERNCEQNHLTYLVRGEHVEFRRIPLQDLGASGDRLLRLLSNLEASGIQLERGMTIEDVRALATELARSGSRGGSARGDGDDGGTSPGDAPDAGDGESRRLAKFRLVSERAARNLESGGAHFGAPGVFATPASPYPAADGATATLELPEYFVSESAVLSMFDSYRVVLGRVEHGEELDVASIRRATEQATSLLTFGDLRLGSSVTQSYFDDFTFHHSINVCLLATQVAGRVIQDEDFLGRISLAALLHDVGKSRVPTEILHKPGRLTDSEFECMRSHPTVGADILLGIEEIDPLCVAVAFGHHMHDGPGSYPTTRVPLPLDWVTELISIVDVYEALTAVRPYKKGLSAARAFEIMLRMPGLRERHDLVRLLYESIGPYPTGTFVELESGVRAVVIDQNPTAPRRPRVRLWSDSSGRRIEEDIEVDLACPPDDVGPVGIVRTVVRQSEDDDPAEVEIEPEPDAFLTGESLCDDEALMTREG